MFTLLCNHHRHPSLELFWAWETETLYPLNSNLLFPPPCIIQQPLFSISLCDLTILGTLYKWNHKGFVLYSIYHSVLKDHLCLSMYQNLLPFEGWIIPLYLYAFCWFIHLFIGTWVASSFWLMNNILLLWIVNNISVNILYMYVFKTLLWSLLGMYPGVELPDHMLIPFLFWEISILFFHSSCNISHGYEQCTRLLISP